MLNTLHEEILKESDNKINDILYNNWNYFVMFRNLDDQYQESFRDFSYQVGDEIKNFIQSALQRQLEEVIKIVEEMKQPNQQVSEYYSGYNSALNSLLIKLKEI